MVVKYAGHARALEQQIKIHNTGNNGQKSGTQQATTFKGNSMKKITLDVKGMHCQSCETLIKDELMELGVDKCEANHIIGKVVVTFDESKISFDAIKSAIAKQGYKVS